MPTIVADDGCRLYFEEAGTGVPLVFVHEFGGDYRSWESQMRHFARRYRCITYSARGYPPSDVPASPDAYSQDRVRDDLLAVLDGLGIAQAHVVGCSMGAFAVLHFGMAHCTSAQSARAHSLTLVGCGSGAHPAVLRKFRDDCKALAADIRARGMARFASKWGHGPTRLPFRRKDPRGFSEHIAQLSAHPVEGSAATMQGYLGTRPSLYDLTDRMAAIDVPLLVVSGDEDELCLEPSLLIKRTVPKAGLSIVPVTGHLVNQEEPAVFNALLEGFLAQVESGHWPERDPLSRPASIWGPAGRPAQA